MSAVDKLRVYLSAVCAIMTYATRTGIRADGQPIELMDEFCCRVLLSETWTAPSTMKEKLDCMERKLLRQLVGYLWPRVCHNEDLHAEIDIVYRRMSGGRYQCPAPPSKVNGYSKSSSILVQSSDRPFQRDPIILPGSSYKKPRGLFHRKGKFWTEVV
ncbi:hypothetical protein RB195_005287 [Necator americanus]|uniref:Uncharacterized protein n=1 Tax=Necator americanus TaxID=51031 RepID=A0ABR1BM44_NECAM